jgi:hypothetical protein
MAWPSILRGGIFGALRRAACLSANRTRAVVPGLVAGLLTIAIPSAGATAGARALFTPAPSSAPKRLSQQDRRIEPIKQRPTTESADLIRIDVGLLRRCSTHDSSPNERNLTFNNGRLECGKDHFRVGLISGTGHGSFVIHDGKVTGTIVRGEATFRVEPVRGMHVLVKVDTARLPTEDAEPDHQQEEHHERRSSRLPEVGGAVEAAPTEIDVLVAYTRSAAVANEDMLGLIHKAILDANASYRNSDIKIRLNLVDSFQFQYSEGSKPFKQIVQDFAKSSVVNSRRDRSGADVSVLIVKGSGLCRPTDTQSGGDLKCCGLADDLMAKEATAFAVVHHECALAPNYSFAHEIGHLQGATHDVDGELPAFRPYGHGLQHNSGGTKWRTIMSYNCASGCPRLPYWSNPRIMRGGVPMGTDDGNDNARLLNETASTVAGFRNRPQARRPILP